MSSETESETPDMYDGDKPALLQVLDDYQAAFSGHDPQGAQVFYHKPCMFIGEQQVAVLGSPSEIEAFFASTMQGLEARGWHHSEWNEVSVVQLSDSAALASTVAVRYLTNGEELERVGATYAFRKTDLSWKIAVVIPHPPVLPQDTRPLRAASRV